MLVFLPIITLATVCAASRLPIVDLGYELHQALSFNSTSGLYNFSNIRYAAPPLGDLRFRAPEPPARNRTRVQDGSVPRICPQATPIWEEYIMPDFLLSLAEGVPFNKSTNISSYPYVPTKLDPRVTEDCLFLDVIVPEKIFNRSASARNSSRGRLAPVLIWIDGGGFVAGDKTQLNPAGLVHRSTVTGDGVIFVSMNYRLGAFGFLAGENQTANVGLLDQRLALEWIQKNIHLFGGDRDRVTVMGDSAGGGSIMHQITAYGGSAGPSPFQQAIVQSPGFTPIPDKKQPEETLRQFLDILNVTTVEQARKLSSKRLIEANAYQIATKSPWGTSLYTPVVDGIFAPKLPGQLLMEGRFDHDMTLMVGFNADEGLEFTSPDVLNGNSNYVADTLKEYYPFITQNITDYIVNVLYPPVYNGSYGYTSPLERSAVFIAESAFQCNTEYLNWAYGNKTFAYEFSVPPALHGQDTLYTFYNEGEPGVEGGLSDLQVKNETIALVMQDYFTSFAESGVPKSPLGPDFKPFGPQNMLLDIGNDTIGSVESPVSGARCRFWQTAPYYQ